MPTGSRGEIRRWVSRTLTERSVERSTTSKVYERYPAQNEAVLNLPMT